MNLHSKPRLIWIKTHFLDSNESWFWIAVLIQIICDFESLFIPPIHGNQCSESRFIFSTQPNREMSRDKAVIDLNPIHTIRNIESRFILSILICQKCVAPNDSRISAPLDFEQSETLPFISLWWNDLSEYIFRTLQALVSRSTEYTHETLYTALQKKTSIYLLGLAQINDGIIGSRLNVARTSPARGRLNHPFLPTFISVAPRTNCIVRSIIKAKGARAFAPRKKVAQNDFNDVANVALRARLMFMPPRESLGAGDAPRARNHAPAHLVSNPPKGQHCSCAQIFRGRKSLFLSPRGKKVRGAFTRARSALIPRSAKRARQTEEARSRGL